MSKCKHAHVAIGETAHEYIEWHLLDGKVHHSSRSAGEMEPQFVVECKDCGFEHTYSRRSKNMPKWVQALTDRIDCHAGEDEDEQKEKERQLRLARFA